MHRRFLDPCPRSVRPWRTGVAAGLAAGLAALASLAGLAGCGAEAPPAEVRGPRVTHVRLEGPIDVGAQSLVSRGIRAAREQGTKTLLIELDTPGGELEVLWDLQKQLLAAEADGLELACWIHQHAASAGALVALTARSVYIAPSGTIGSAYPVVATANGMQSLPEDGGVREKQLSFLRSQFRSAAERRGRPPALAMGMVDPDVEVRQVRVDNETKLVDGAGWDDLRESGVPYELVTTIKAKGRVLNLSAKQAVELRFVDGLAESLDQVLERLGYVAGDATAVIERSGSDRAVVWIERLTPLLILAGLVLGYLELKLPGFGLPGILSASCFLLVVGGKYLAGVAEVAHVVAVAAGLALLVLEILVLPGTLWLGVTGGVLLAGGLILASVGPGFSFSDPLLVERLLDTGIEYAVASVLAIAVAMAITRFLPQTPMLRRAVLVPDPAGAFGGGVPEAAVLPALGARGTALTDLRPVGKVGMDGQRGRELEARSVGPFVQAGARVRVVEVGTGRLVVEREPGDHA